MTNLRERIVGIVRAREAGLDRLNAAILDLEQVLHARYPKRAAAIDLDAEHALLWWRGFYLMDAERRTVPLVKASVRYRLLASRALDDLVIQLDEESVDQG